MQDYSEFGGTTPATVSLSDLLKAKAEDTPKLWGANDIADLNRINVDDHLRFDIKFSGILTQIQINPTFRELVQSMKSGERVVMHAAWEMDLHTRLTGRAPAVPTNVQRAARALMSPDVPEYFKYTVPELI